ncbi:YadA-like family protein [Rodentibacter haemolyticus]|uniref:YadA-like family protein n=1 Tax=Rodentibacter haemolyticus TaxID=2778911 RepID=A0ABX6UVW6_9PAST|nr:YadA-like family protein [Rodentibacter haemolyticus]QPB41962.1 YadA-like family protein [Rodentibacter haemolyticus]
MNKIFKVIWNHATQTWVAVSELNRAKGKTKSSSNKQPQLSTIALSVIAASSTVIGGEALAVASSGNGRWVTDGGDMAVSNDTNYPANATGGMAIAIGTNSNATGQGAVAIGHDATAVKNFATAMGQGATANENYSTALGASAKATREWSVAFGANAQSTGSQTTAIGVNTIANTTNSIALGIGAKAYGQRIVNGDDQGNAVAIGPNAEAGGGNSLAMGDTAKALGNWSIANGVMANATHNHALAMGGMAKALAERTTAIGAYSNAANAQGTAIGAYANATANQATALGIKARASAANATALGQLSQANLENSVALGSFATTKAGTVENSATVNGVTYSGFAGVLEVNQLNHVVSVGGNATVPYRQIQNVAAGNISLSSTDAINGSQLYAVMAKLNNNGTSAYSFNVGNNTSQTVKTISSGNNVRFIDGNYTTAKVASTTSGANVTFDVKKGTFAPVTASGQLNATTALDGVATVQDVKNAVNQGFWRIGNSSSSSGTAVNNVHFGDRVDFVGEGSATVTVSKGPGNAPDTATIVKIKTPTYVNGTGITFSTDPNTGNITISATGGSSSGGTAENYFHVNDSTANQAAGNPDTNKGTVDAKGGATGKYAITGGVNAKAGGANSMAIGFNASASGVNSIAMGLNANASSTRSIVIGENSSSSQNQGIAIGFGAQASRGDLGNNGIAIGTNANASHHQTVAIGWDAKASDNAAVAMGWQANASGEASIVLGSQSKAYKNDSISLGRNATTNALQSIAIGYSTLVTGVDAIGMGRDTHVTGQSAVAIGNGSKSHLQDSVALGSKSETSNGTAVTSATVNNITYSGFKGALTANTLNRVVSVGTVGNERQIQNVAAGKISADSTDAINGSQLYMVASGLKDAMPTVAAGTGITVTPATNTNGSITYNVSTAITNFTTNSNTGAFNQPAGVEGSKFVNATTLYNALSNAGWRTNAAGNTAAGANLTEQVINPGEAVNFIGGEGVTINRTVANGVVNYTFNATANVANTSLTVGTDGKVAAPIEGDKLVNATTVTNAINNAFHTVNTSSDDTQVTDSPNGTGTQVKAGDTLTYKAGKNLNINQNGKTITYGLSENISVNNITANNITVGNTTITNGTISGLNNELAPTNNVATNSNDNKVSQTAPTTVNGTNAATVNDVLNAGWNLQENGTAKDFVAAYDTVNFVNGTGTEVKIDTTNGNVSTVKVNVKVDNSTITTDPNTGEVKANVTDLTTNPNGTIKVVDGGNGSNLVNATTVTNAINNAFHTVNTTNTGEAVTAANGTTQVKAGSELEFVAGKNLVVNQTGGRIAFATAENVTFNNVNTTTLTIGNVSDPTAPTTNISSTDKGLDIGGDKITNVSTALNNTTIQTTSDSNTGDNKNKFINLTNPSDPSAVVTVGDLQNYGWVVRADGNDYTAAVRNANTVNFIGKNGVNVTGEANATTGIYDITVTGKEVNYTVNNETVTNGTNGEPANQSTVNNVNYVNGTGTTPNVTLNNGSLNVGFDINTTNGTVNPNGTVSVTKGEAFLNATEVANLVNDSSFNITTAKEETQVKSGGHDPVKVKAGDTITYKAGKNLEINQTGSTLIYGLSSDINVTSITVGNTTITNGTISGLNSNLPPTYNKDVYNTENKDVTTSQTLPENLNVTNAATVGDILNSGWNLQENGTAKDFVKPYDTVNFVNGTATTANITTDDGGKVSVVKYDVNVDDDTIKVVDGKLVANASNIVKGDNTTTNVTNGTVSVKTGDVTANTTTGKAESNVTNGTIATVTDVANTINNVFHTVNTSTSDEQVVTGANATGTKVKAGDTLTYAAGKNLEINQTGSTITYGLSENITVNNVNTTTLTVGNVSDKVAPKVDFNAEKATPATNNPTQPDFALNITTNGKPTQITGVGSTLNTKTVPDTVSGDTINPTTNTPSNVLVDLSNPEKPDSAATVRDLQNLGWVVKATGNNYSDTVKNANEVNFVGTNGVTVEGKTEGGARTITVKGKEVNYTVNNQTVTNGTNGEPANQSTVNNVNYVNGTGTTPNVTLNNGSLNVGFDVNTTSTSTNNNGTAKLDDPAQGSSFVNASTLVDTLNNVSHNITASNTNGGKDGVQTVAGSNQTRVKAGDTVTYSAGKNLVVNQSTDGNGNHIVEYGLSTDINVTSITVGNTTITNGTISGLNGNLPPTYNNDVYNTKNEPVTKEQTLPTNLNVTNAATVGDILNSGWNLQENGTAKDFVKPYDTVNFVNGTATTANITTDDDGKVSVVKYNVNVDDATIKVVDGKLVANASNIVKGDNTTTNVTNGTVTVKTGDVTANSTTGKAESNVTNGTIATVTDVANTINSVFHTVNATNTGEAVTAANGTTQVKAGSELEFVAGKNLVVNQTGGRIAFATAENVTFNNVNATTLTIGNVSNATAPKVDFNAENAKPATNNNASNAPEFALNITTNGKPTQITGVGSVLNLTDVTTNPGDKDGARQPDVTKQLVNLTNLPEGTLNSAATVRDLVNMGWVVKATGNNYSNTVKNANEVNFVGAGGVTVEGSDNGDVRTITIKGKEVNYTVNNQTIPNATTPVNQSTVNNVNYVNGTGTTPNVTINNGTLNVGFDINTTSTSTNENGTAKLDDPAQGASFVNASTLVDTLNNVSHNITASNANGGKDGVQTVAGSNQTRVKAGDTVTYSAGKNLVVNQSTDGNGNHIVEYGLSSDINVTSVTVGNTSITNGTISGLNSHFNNASSLTGGTNVVNSTAPANISNNLTEGATVQDVLNSGWNLQENGKAKDFVAAYDTVNFNNGSGTEVKIDSDGTKSNITVNVKYDGSTITLDANGNLSANSTNIANAAAGNVSANATTGKAEYNNANGSKPLATVEDVANTINSVYHTVNTSSNNDQVESNPNATGTKVKAGDSLTYVAGKNLEINQNGSTITYGLSKDITVSNVNTTTLTVGNVSNPTAPKVDFNSDNATPATNNPTQPDFALNITTNGKPTQITGVGSTLNTTTVPNTASGDVINPTTNTSSNVLVDLSNPTKPDSAATVRDLQNMGWIVEASGNSYADTVKNANRVNFKGDNAINVTGSTENGVRTITVTAKTDGTTITIDPNKGLVANTTNIVANPNGTVSVDPAGNGGNLVNGTTVVNAINSAGHNIKAAKTNDLVTSNNGTAKVNPGKTVTYQAGKNLEANITVNANGDSTVTYGLSNDISVNTVQVGGNTGPTITGDKNGNVVIGKADANGNLAPAQIKNVAPGTEPNDAVNVSQLKGVANNINNRINKVDKGLRAGIAGANAAAGLPQVYLPGKSMVAASAGHFKGENALAVGYSRASDNGKLILKLQGNTNSRGDVGGSVGIGYQW